MIDLHIHSTASDGTDSVPELIRNIRNAGISVFSVTDHDTVKGAMEMEAMVPLDMTFIRGIELTCRTEAGKCHILGYGFDWHERVFKDILEEGASKRREKTEKRIHFMEKEFGIAFSEDELSELHSMNSVGKPQLGMLLVAKGLAPDKDTAVKKFIDPCKTGEFRLDGKKAVRAILSAGGVPVWAHPFGGTDEDEVSYPDFEKQLGVLIEAGIQGLECYYPKYPMEQVELLLAAARKNGLFISGGSDYHGKNKKVRLGTLNASNLQVDESMISVLEKLWR